MCCWQTKGINCTWLGQRCSSAGWALDPLCCWYRFDSTVQQGIFLLESAVSAGSLPVFLQPWCALCTLTSTYMLKIPSIGSHAIVWIHEDTTLADLTKKCTHRWGYMLALDWISVMWNRRRLENFCQVNRWREFTACDWFFLQESKGAQAYLHVTLLVVSHFSKQGGGGGAKSLGRLWDDKHT